MLPSSLLLALESHPSSSETRVRAVSVPFGLPPGPLAMAPGINFPTPGLISPLSSFQKKILGNLRHHRVKLR